MPCYSPLSAYKLYSGEVVFSVAKAGHTYSKLQLPCGQCVGCRLERSRQWAMRCVHESKMHKENSFVTLTYDDEHLPNELKKEHFQKFIKRLRWHKNEPLRYYMCGEYGTETKRPHYHSCMFGYRPNDMTYHMKSPSGENLYTSEELTKIWGMGHVVIGELTFESAAYTARYIMTKRTGDEAKAHYTRLQQDGSMKEIQPEYNDMSRRPGIGASFYQKYKTDIFPHDYVIVNATECQPPKYYTEILEKEEPSTHAAIKEKRVSKAMLRAEDNTPARLHAKMTVTEAKLRFLNRTKA